MLKLNFKGVKQALHINFGPCRCSIKKFVVVLFLVKDIAFLMFVRRRCGPREGAFTRNARLLNLNY